MTSENCYNIFVYGSLRSGFKSPAYDYISHFFSFVGNAKVKGRLYDLGPYPAGVPSDGDTFIVGELYTIKNQAEFSWAMAQLDDYEGTAAEEGEISLYERTVVDVFTNDSTIAAWIYWYTGDVSSKTLIESGDMIQYLREKNSPGAPLRQ